MNLDELQSVRDRERQTDKPQQLRETFYEDVGAFVEQLRAERERAVERHGSHYADEVMQLTDEIETTRNLVEKLHERRIGKIVKAASLEAADLSPDVGGLTAEEQELFETLVTDIESHRGDVLAAIDAEESPADEGAADRTTDEGTAERTTDEASTTAAAVMGSGESSEEAVPAAGGREASRDEGETRSEHPDPDELRPDGATAGGPASGSGGSPGTAAGGDPPTSGPRDDGSEASPGPAERVSQDIETAGGELTVSRGGKIQSDGSGRGGDERHADEQSVSIERERVLITEDIDTFVGPDDRDYDLATDDVVTLPATNATLLVERDAARRL